MPEFFLELFSEEIPARMQTGAAAELERICLSVLSELSPQGAKTYSGPRRIAFSAEIAEQKPGGVIEARGPRDTAPEAALAGFLNKQKALREELVVEAGYYWLRRAEPAVPASQLIAIGLPAALAKFSWPKSMRWGQSGSFAWVRPLRRIICLLDGEIIPITLGPVAAGNETEGHRFLQPGAFAVSSNLDWLEKLRSRKVFVDRSERLMTIVEGLKARAGTFGLTIASDDALLDEVNGLVEWPVPLIGRIGVEFMDLPPEVRELSMKVNQRYFALRDAAGEPAPYFAFVANIEAEDGGAAIITGNERVLRARLADARHFWELDLKTPLDALLPKLEKITFHARLGTQRERAERIAARAAGLALALGGDQQASFQAERAGLLCKADLVTFMVGEFPELQGITGGYYAEKNLRDPHAGVVGAAIRTHYQPKGPTDEVPTGIVAISVALADKLDTLAAFFNIGEKPTGAGDPYALRRAALGVIRIILENNLSLNLKNFLGYRNDLRGAEALFDFIIERLRVKLRGEGQRYDILDAVLGSGADDDLHRLMRRVRAVSDFLASADGANLLAAYRRAANILRIEDARDGPHRADTGETNLGSETADRLRGALLKLGETAVREVDDGNYAQAMTHLARLRATVDDFFDNVTVNVPEMELRRNRLQLLAKLRDTMHIIADFSKIEG